VAGPGVRRAVHVVAVNVAVLIVLTAFAEAVGQCVAAAWPAYDVLFVSPDRELGWKLTPGLSWTWTGHRRIALEFSAEGHANALGFRDIDHQAGRRPGVRRVALLGDSFVEAVQVSFPQTSAQRLQVALNESHSANWEVLNFGVSNFGIGQYLLTWERYAARFAPEVVAVFVSGLQMERTVQRQETGAFPETEALRLRVRPTFSLRDGVLVREPARDFELFRRVQTDRIMGQRGGAGCSVAMACWFRRVYDFWHATFGWRRGHAVTGSPGRLLTRAFRQRERSP